MHISKVRLENIGPFSEWEREFKPGVTAIIGPNGSGKSTLLQSIYAAFSNDFGRHGNGVKLETISVTAAEDAPSNVSVWAEHHGVQLELVRRLRPASSELRCISTAETTRFRKAEEIAKTIEAVLGLPLSFLGDYVFVDQWAVFAWMILPPAERGKAFQRLFRTDIAERCWEAAGAELTRLPAIASPEDDAPLEQSLVAAESRLVDSELRRQTAVAKQASPEQVVDWRRIVEGEQVRLRLEQQAAELRGQLLVAEPNYAIQKKLTDEHASVLELCRAKVGELRQAAAACSDKLAQWKLHHQATAARLVVCKQRDAVLADNQREPPVVDLQLVSAAQTQLAEAEAELAGYQKFLTTFDSKNGLAACPVCGTSVSSLKDRYDTLSEGAGLICEARDVLVKLVSEAREAVSRRRQWEGWKSNHDQQLLWTQTQLANTAAVSAPVEPEPELRGTVAGLGVEESKLVAAEQLHRQLELGLERAKAMVTSLQMQLDNVNNFSTTGLLDELAVIQAKAGLDEYEALSALVAMFAGECRSNQAARDELVRLVETRKQARQRSVARNQWEGRLNELRQVLHREALPRIVAQNYLESLEQSINELLELFDAPFRVASREGLSFLAKFHDGRQLDMRRLSGGQKVVLAMAFRIAVNSLFAEELGLLCLDEPTAGLDRQNLRGFELAVGRLQLLAKSRGLQCLIVTHEEWLAGMFDNVISLAGVA